MFSLSLLLTFSQLTALAVGTGFQLAQNGALPIAKKSEIVNSRTTSQSSKWTTVTVSTSVSSTTSRSSSQLSTKSSTTRSTTNSASSTTSANPNCPTTFQLVVPVGRFGNDYVWVDAKGQYNIYNDMATNFTIRDHRLLTLSSPGGYAGIPKSTNETGNYLTSTPDATDYNFPDATLDQNCHLVLTKKISATYTLDSLYLAPGTLYLASQNNPPANGYQVSPSARPVGPVP